jgi:tetratricopeptide (TPR) repeat protein
MLVEAEQPSANPDVWALVLKGWAAVFSAGTRGLEGAKLGKPYFTQALERDPDNVSARIGLAAVLLTFSSHGLAEDREASLTRAETLLREALARKPNLTAANYFMSVVHRLRGRLADAIDSLERAIERNPSHASSYAHLGFILSRMGRAAEGLEHIRYAKRLSPRDPILSFWLNYEGAAELELARDTEAIEHFRQAIALYPRYALAWAGLAAAYALSGSIDEAKSAVAKLHALFPDVSDEALVARLGPRGSQPLRFTDGLHMAFAHPPSSL